MWSMCYIERCRLNACVEDKGGGEGKKLTSLLRSAYHAIALHEFFVAVYGVLVQKVLQI